MLRCSRDRSSARNRASLQFRAYESRPPRHTCCPSTRSMISMLSSMLATRQKARAPVGSPVDPRAIGSSTMRAKRRTSEGRGEENEEGEGPDYGRSFSASLGRFTILRAREGTGAKSRGQGDDYARLFNTKGSKTNTERRRAAARPVIDNVPGLSPFVMRQPFSKLR